MFDDSDSATWHQEKMTWK